MFLYVTANCRIDKPTGLLQTERSRVKAVGSSLEARVSETVFCPPIEVNIVGRDDDRFYAQRGREPILYVLPRAAFVTRGKALLVDGSGEIDVWMPSPQTSPADLCGTSAVSIVCVSGGEEYRSCYPSHCNTCRNHECMAYTGPQGRSAPSWHTLSPHGKMVSAWSLHGQKAQRINGGLSNGHAVIQHGLQLRANLPEAYS